MKRVSKFLSVMAISAAILLPTTAQAEWGPWGLDVAYKERIWAGGGTVEVLNCYYVRYPTGGGFVAGVERKRVTQFPWSPGGLTCPNIN